MHDAYVIWSFEHDGWWRPAGIGYTPALAEAGHYTLAEAVRIVSNANQYVKVPHEMWMPLRVARAYELKGWHPVSPGAYDDHRGGLHLVLEEMLAFYGYADTPENRQTMIRVASEMFDGPVEVEE